MTNKDVNKRNFIKEALPLAKLIICVFHILRIFYCEITREKKNITRKERDQTKESLQKMVFAATPEE